MKKTLSVLLSLLLVFALATSAFATSELATSAFTATTPALTVYTIAKTSWSLWNITHPNATSSPLVITSGSPWTASTTADWIKISAKEGSAGEKTITVTIAANIIPFNQTGYIKIYNCGGTKTVEINQPAGKGINIGQPETSWSIWNITHPNETTSPITITSSIKWEAKVSAGATSWIEIKPDSGEAGKSTSTVSIKANKTPEKRTGEIYIKNLVGTKTIVINQPAGLIATPLPPGGNYWDDSFDVYQQKNYGQDIAANGCGPTSLANAIRYYTKSHGKYRDVNPREVYDLAKKLGLYGPGGISIWGMVSNDTIQNRFKFSASEIFGQNYKKTDARKQMAIDMLKSGAVLIVSAPNSYYYNGGSSSCYHVVAISGYLDGKVLILDSANRTYNYCYNGRSINYPNARDFGTLWKSISCCYEVIPK